GKDALISSLKRRVNSLEKEKKMLKEEISVLYSRLYEDI
ncbi:TPA: transposase, partial [Staphylococcus aureus]|nr:transposase [Staphylococcus aureus]